jgi:hypothetical protein
MVDRPRAIGAAREARDRTHRDAAGRAIPRGVVAAFAVLAGEAQVEGVRKQPSGRLVARDPERYPMDAVQRVLGRDAGGAPPCGTGGRSGMPDDLEHEPVGIAERDHLLGRSTRVPARRGPVERHAMPHQPLDPEPDRRGHDPERRDRDLPGADAAAPRPRPREEREQTPRGTHLVAEIEVVGVRVVEVDRALDQP